MENESAILPETVNHIKKSLELSRARAPLYCNYVNNWLNVQRIDIKGLLNSSLNLQGKDTPQAYKLGVLIFCDFIQTQPNLLSVKLNHGERFIDRLQSHSPEFMEFVKHCEEGKCFVPSVVGKNAKHELVNGIWDAVDVLC